RELSLEPWGLISRDLESITAKPYLSRFVSIPSRLMVMPQSSAQGKLRFDLIGDDPDGLAMALTLHGSGRFELKVYGGPNSGAVALGKEGITFQRANDLEDLLANPESDLVIVADKSGRRAEQLRRALQSEKHVLCVYPPNHSPEIAYEAAMIQADTHRVL